MTTPNNSSVVLSTATNTSDASLPSANDTVVTDVSFEPSRISTNVQATVVVTVQNPQSTADTHPVELEMFGQVMNSREVTVPARGETTVEFSFSIVEPGTYTARVDSETATVTVVEPAEATGTPTPSTSTQFPGFGAGVALSALALAALFLARRD